MATASVAHCKSEGKVSCCKGHLLLTPTPRGERYSPLNVMCAGWVGSY